MSSRVPPTTADLTGDATAAFARYLETSGGRGRASVASHLARGVVVRTVQATIMRLAQHANRAGRVAHAGAGTGDGLAGVVALGCAHPRALRHGYVLRYLSRDGATLAGLARALGHTAVATTARYLVAHEAALEPALSDSWTR
ncbi:MAG: hypothetical protein ACR2NB_11525 [Solirubrobacteraceae bacterium]